MNIKRNTKLKIIQCFNFQVFNDKGEFMWMVGRQGKEDPGEFDRPCDAFIDPEGHIHLMDFGNDRIQVF